MNTFLLPGRQRGELLKAQVRRNRELFPVNAGGGTVRMGRRSFEDLLKE